MPTWLIHGFRWPRAAIRIHIILQNLEDCAPEWLMAPATVAQMTSNFQKLYAEQMKRLPNLRFIEQYDPYDETVKDQPYAYVCDQVHEVKLGVDIDEVRGAGVPPEAWTALVELRDKVAEGQKVGWFVVVNGDVERWAPPVDDEEEQEKEEVESANGLESQVSPVSQRSSIGKVEEVDGEPKQKGLKGWLGKVKKARSTKNLRGEMAIRTAPMSPPLPNRPFDPTSPRTTNGKAPMPVRAV